MKRPSTPPAVRAAAIVHTVSDPVGTAAVLVDALGFQVRAAAEGEGVVVENGVLALRLVPAGAGAAAAARPLDLDVETDDLAAVLEALRRCSRVIDPGKLRKVSPNRVTRRIELEGDVVVTLSQGLTEDDLGLLPALPVVLPWDRASDLLVRRVLRAVPLGLRSATRMRVTRRAEAVALEAGKIAVDKEEAVRGLVEAMPDLQHDELALVLLAEGVDLTQCLEGCREAG